MNTSIDIQHLCDLAHKAFNAPVHILSADRKFLYHSTSDNVCSPFYSSKKNILVIFIKKTIPVTCHFFEATTILKILF